MPGFDQHQWCLCGIDQYDHTSLPLQQKTKTAAAQQYFVSVTPMFPQRENRNHTETEMMKLIRQNIPAPFKDRQKWFILNVIKYNL